MISRGWIRDLLVVIEAPPGTLGRPFSVGFSLWTSYIFAIYHLFKCPNNISATLSLVTFVQAYSFNNVESDSCFMEFVFHHAFLARIKSIKILAILVCRKELNFSCFGTTRFETLYVTFLAKMLTK